MQSKPSNELNPVVRRFVEDAGNATQSFGIGRVLGQIYAFLYFSAEPRNLSDLESVLGISKGSASTGVRQLEQWGAVRKVWVKGDRKGYYEADEWFGRALRSAVLDTVAKRLDGTLSLLKRMEVELAQQPDGDKESEFIKNRIDLLRRFHTRAEKIWTNPLVSALLK